MTMFRGGSGGRGGRGVSRGGGDRGGRGGGRGRGGDRGRGGRDSGRGGRGRGGNFERQKRSREDGDQQHIERKIPNEETEQSNSNNADEKNEQQGAPSGATTTTTAAPPAGNTEQTFSKPSSAPRKGKTLVIILAKAGLILGAKGMVDAYERSISTAISNESVADVRPDIVHQCLLSIFDSNMSYYGNVKVYIETTKGKTIQINPKWRPPRTFQRFRGLMENLFRDGKIVSDQGEVLLSFMRGTVAPIVPHGAEVVALSNEAYASVVRPNQFAQSMMDSPVPDDLQGGLKNCYGFVVVSCQENGNLAGIPLVSDSVCLSPYPMSPHVMLSRLCEGFANQLQIGMN